MLEFEILGPLVVRGDDGEIRVAGAIRRALLVRLLVSANELVPASRLADDLWAGEPSAAATSTLQSHISLLRKALGPGRLVGRDGGYVLEVADGEFDVRRFEDESRRGRRALAAGDAAEAARLLDASLGRWRGAALADASGAAWARAEQTRLEELRLEAIETCLEARLELGEHQEVAALAEAAVADHPLREELWGCLMLALYRSGRQSDALRAFQRLRTRLGDELGIGPSAPLVALDDAIVQQKPELNWTGAERGAGTGPALPTGVVSLLVTDIEGSTRLWEAHPQEMGAALERHDELFRCAVADAGGYVFKTVGDGVYAAFATPQGALATAVNAQRAIRTGEWPDQTPIHVRMGLHSGLCDQRDGDYFGPTVNRVARLAATASGGQIVVSGSVAELLGDALPEGTSLVPLGEHKLKDLARPEQVFQVVAAGLDRDFPPLRTQTTDARRHNLPEQISSFVGRTAQLAAIRRQLASSRLVTLTGPGGAGKTRLALQVGAELVDAHRDGVWLVELAAVSDAAMVARTVARVLLVREEADQPIAQTLAASVAGRQLLLVLDNCEQVLGASATLAALLLAQCPELSILATSREPLGLPGEALIRVPSMTVPPEDVVDPDALGDFESTRLFVERAATHQAGFRVDETNHVAVASVCRRLDGIPLAIELAAVRVRSLTPGEIDARLGDRFRLLTGGSRALAPRQQTLRSAIDWSYDLLTPKEQAVLARLSVFAGGWSLDAAEVVAAGGAVEEWELLDLLSSLVDKSLIQRDTRVAISRFAMLDSVRHYAADALDRRDGSDEDMTRDAHGRFFLSLTETAALHIHGAQQPEWFDRLDLDHENLRVALERFLADPSAVEDAFRMVLAMDVFWNGGGHYAEGTESLEAVLARADSHDHPARRGRALAALGDLLMRQGNNADAGGRLDEALAIARRTGNPGLEAEVLTTLVWLRYIQGADVARLADDAVSVARSSGDPFMIAVALERRADIDATDDVETSRARADYAEALALFRSIGDMSSVGAVLSNLGVLELKAGELDEAKSHLDAAWSLLVESNRVDGLPAALCNLGVVSLLQDDPLAAQSPFAEALSAARRIGMRVLVGYAVLGLALCASAVGNSGRAAMLHGAADRIFEDCGEAVQPLEDALRRSDLARLSVTMADGDFAEAYETGRSWTLSEAVEMALTVPSIRLDTAS